MTTVINNREAYQVTHSTEDLKPLTFWEVVGSTFAGALGVQSHQNRQRDFTRGSILAFIFSGLLFTVGFVAAVVFVVSKVI